MFSCTFPILFHSVDGPPVNCTYQVGVDRQVPYHSRYSGRLNQSNVLSV